MKKILLMTVFTILLFPQDLINSYSNYVQALQIAKDTNRTLLILFVKKSCQWCKKLENTTLKDKNLTKRIEDEAVFVILDKDRDKYPKRFNIESVPYLFFVNPKTQEIYTDILGYHKNPRDYIKWFDYIKIENEDID